MENKKENKTEEICDKCAGNNYPMGEYCQGCNMTEYRRNKGKTENKKEILICIICKRNIREINCFPIYSKKHNDIICSNCCVLGALFSIKTIDEEDLKPIPIEIRKQIMEIYDDN